MNKLWFKHNWQTSRNPTNIHYRQKCIVDQLTFQLMPHPPLSPKTRTAGSVLTNCLHINFRWKYLSDQNTNTGHILFLYMPVTSIRDLVLFGRTRLTWQQVIFLIQLQHSSTGQQCQLNFSVFSILSHLKPLFSGTIHVVNLTIRVLTLADTTSSVNPQDYLHYISLSDIQAKSRFRRKSPDTHQKR